MFLPDHVHSSSPDLGVAAHDGHAGSKRAVDTEHYKVRSPRQHRQVAVRKRMVTPKRGRKGGGEREREGGNGRARERKREEERCRKEEL